MEFSGYIKRLRKTLNQRNKRIRNQRRKIEKQKKEIELLRKMLLGDVNTCVM